MLIDIKCIKGGHASLACMSTRREKSEGDTERNRETYREVERDKACERATHSSRGQYQFSQQSNLGPTCPPGMRSPLTRNYSTLYPVLSPLPGSSYRGVQDTGVRGRVRTGGTPTGRRPILGWMGLYRGPVSTLSI